MNNVAKAWVEDLQTTTAKQGKQVLHNLRNNSFCCLGRLCVLFDEAHPNEPINKEERGDLMLYDRESKVLPERVRVWVGLKNRFGHFGDHNSLVNANDSGKTFVEIAQIIVENESELFDKAKQEREGYDRTRVQ